MSDLSTDFFDGIGGGAGAPSPLLSNPGDGVIGEIVEMFKRDYVPYESRKTREPARKDDGSAVQQLVITLQTVHRNWENVAKVPKVDPADPNSAEKPPSADDGKRAVFAPEGKNIQFAIGRAVSAARAEAGKPVPFEVGGTLGVKIFNLKDTGQGNPLKEHEAVYRPKPTASAGDAFLAGAPAAAPVAQAAPAAAPVAQTAPPAVQAAQAPAPAAPEAAPAAPAAGDPWATPSAAAPAAGDPWASPSAPTTAPPF